MFSEVQVLFVSSFLLPFLLLQHRGLWAGQRGEASGAPVALRGLRLLMRRPLLGSAGHRGVTSPCTVDPGLGTPVDIGGLCTPHPHASSHFSPPSFTTPIFPLPAWHRATVGDWGLPRPLTFFLSKAQVLQNRHACGEGDGDIKSLVGNSLSTHSPTSVIPGYESFTKYVLHSKHGRSIACFHMLTCFHMLLNILQVNLPV